MKLLIASVIMLTLAVAILLVPNVANAADYLTDFNYGVTNDNKRYFTLLVEENHKIPITSSNKTANETIYFPAWTFNGTVPGPTMRMTEGDHVFVKVINSNQSKHSHSLHMHSVHPPSMDGTFGPSGSIDPGQSFTYEFIAGPVGVYPYHCHVEPVVDHINRGLYGMMIIDPANGRAQANEMVMTMNSYDLDLNEELIPTFRPPTVDEANQIMGAVNTNTNTTTMEPITPIDGMSMNTVIESNTASQISNDNDNSDGGDSGSNDNDNNDGSNDSGNSDDNDGGSNNGGSEDSGNSDGGSDNGSTSDSGTESDDNTTSESVPTANGTEVEAPAEEAELELEIERDNEFYTLNGRAFEYMDNPIQIKVGEPVRIYLLNMIEFDPVNSFHLHAGMFNYTSAGTLSTPPTLTDIVTIGQGDRGIIEFTPQHPGKMMIHAHINEFTALGWMGTFEVS